MDRNKQEIDREAQTVLARYWPSWGGAPVPLVSTGFSGARLWRVAGIEGDAVLRRWPAEHPTRERLAFIHDVLARAAEHGFRKLPLPWKTAGGDATFAVYDGRLWELDQWLPGTADYWTNPSEARLRAALVALAKFHAAAREDASSGQTAASPGVRERRVRLDHFLTGGAAALAATVKVAPPSPVTVVIREWLSLFDATAAGVSKLLEDAERIHVPLQPCLRDIWHDHVLFIGDEVTGLLDVGAMRMENVAADVARLLGSLVEDDAASWEIGLAAYQTVRPLSDAELHLIAAFDRSTVLMTGMNWGEWLFVERRTFQNEAAIVQRLETGMRRLRKLVSQ